MKKTALEIAKKRNFKTFRISVKRIDKKFSKDSMQVEREIGQYIVDNLKKKVSLREFDLEISIELLENNAYIYGETVKCHGGLPFGSSAKVLCNIKDTKSELAAVLVMKRGCAIAIVSKIKTEMLDKYAYGPSISRFDDDDLDKLAAETNSFAIVKGTTFKEFKMENLKTPILYPLIGMTDSEINDKIGEFR